MRYGSREAKDQVCAKRIAFGRLVGVVSSEALIQYGLGFFTHHEYKDRSCFVSSVDVNLGFIAFSGCCSASVACVAESCSRAEDLLDATEIPRCKCSMKAEIRNPNPKTDAEAELKRASGATERLYIGIGVFNNETNYSPTLQAPCSCMYVFCANPNIPLPKVYSTP